MGTAGDADPLTEPQGGPPTMRLLLESFIFNSFYDGNSKIICFDSWAHTSDDLLQS